ncbi:hypothetical protein [Amycolatopsis sp. NPDC003731]
MITMPDRSSPTCATFHAFEALDTALEPVRAISKAVEFSPSASMGEVLVTWHEQQAGFDVRQQWFHTVTPALHQWAAMQAIAPVGPVLLSTPLLAFTGQLRAQLIDLFRPLVQTADEVARWMHAALIEAAERAHAVLCTDPDVRRRKAAVE